MIGKAVYNSGAASSIGIAGFQQAQTMQRAYMQAKYEWANYGAEIRPGHFEAERQIPHEEKPTNPLLLLRWHMQKDTDKRLGGVSVRY